MRQFCGRIWDESAKLPDNGRMVRGNIALRPLTGAGIFGGLWQAGRFMG